MSARDQRTVVEVVDTTGCDVAHITKEVRVNGSPVRLAENGIAVEHGYGEPTKVTLTLIVDDLHFRQSNVETGQSTGPHIHFDIEGIANSAINEALRRGEFRRMTRP